MSVIVKGQSQNLHDKVKIHMKKYQTLSLFYIVDKDIFLLYLPNIQWCTCPETEYRKINKNHMYKYILDHLLHRGMKQLKPLQYMPTFQFSTLNQHKNEANITITIHAYFSIFNPQYKSHIVYSFQKSQMFLIIFACEKLLDNCLTSAILWQSDNLHTHSLQLFPFHPWVWIT